MTPICSAGVPPASSWLQAGRLRYMRFRCDLDSWRQFGGDSGLASSTPWRKTQMSSWRSCTEQRDVLSQWQLSQIGRSGSSGEVFALLVAIKLKFFTVTAYTISRQLFEKIVLPAFRPHSPCPRGQFLSNHGCTGCVDKKDNSPARVTRYYRCFPRKGV